MSFEYSLEFSGQASVAAIVVRLGALGLLPRDVRNDGAVLAYASTPAERLFRWGGDVEISVAPNGLLVTMSTDDHQHILRAILDELAEQGMSVRVDEP